MCWKEKKNNMAEVKRINSLFVVTDSETYNDKIGDIDGGGFDKEWLKTHIKKYGPQQLFEKLAWMNYQIYDIIREVNEEQNNLELVNKHICRFSKAMHQPYPRLCVDCGKPEENNEIKKY